MNGGVRWTKAQKKAIAAAGRDVRVSASAGTGKTAVLAQRCLERICDPGRPTDVDRLLVLTYTDAAAEEMRGRIAQTLRRALRERPSDHLRRQGLLLDAAWISTFHAFCKRILTEHFYLLNLDPAFGVVDPDQQRLLQAEAMIRTLEEAWADAALAEGLRDMFARRNVQPFAPGSFTGEIFSIYEFLESIPDADAFFERAEKLSGDSMVEAQREMILRTLRTCRQKVDHTVLLDRQFTGGKWLGGKLDEYYDVITMLEKAAGKIDLAKLGEVIAGIDFPRLPNRPKDMDKEQAEQIKAPVNEARGDVKDLLNLAAVSPAAVGAEAAGQQTRTLLELVRRFGQAYASAKEQITALDFSDLEQYSLRLLTGRPEVAEKLRQRFEYIFVDEFQDINAVQKRILDAVRRPDNVFLVGDVKQSIYAFRRSRPELFLEALAEASEEPQKPDEAQRIDLGENFRSRREILEFTNAVFERIMTEETASMDYDRRAALKFARPDAADDTLSVEVILLDEDEPETDEDTEETSGDEETEVISALQRQAAFVARRILQMVGANGGKTEFQIYDKQIEAYRDVQYRDIVILMRSVAHRANEYTEILRLAGIPVSSQTSSGYFATTEIADMLALLKVLDNPIRDIELAAVLRSAMFTFTDSELAEIRLGSDAAGRKDGTYYDALRLASQKGPQPLREKAQQALERLKGWREAIRAGSLSDVLGQILESTGYLAFVSALPNGRQRRANLLKLHDRAIQFEHFSSGPQSTSLARFVEFLEQLAEQEQDWAPAQPDSAAENAVRIFSVHRSKGLEFPVVILAELNTQFNTRDLSGPCLADEDGLGLQVIVTQRDVQIPTAAHQVICERKRKTMLEEEMRILYVALTRAREKLIVTAGRKADHCRKLLEDCAVLGQQPVPGWKLQQVRRPIDWVLYGLGNRAALQRLYLEDEAAGADANFFTARRIGADELKETTDFIERSRQARLSAVFPKVDQSIQKQAAKLHEELSGRFQWEYPFAESTGLPAKLSVSELTHRTDEFSPAVGGGVLQRVPDVLTGEAATKAGAAEVGTATHLLLARLDLKIRPDRQAVEKTIEMLCGEGLISTEAAGRIDIQSILGFFDSDLGQLACQYAETVLREWPFTLAVSARQAGLGETEEKIIVQGIVDLIIPTNKGLVLVDFKTDRISADQIAERAERYRMQIRYYALAAERILGRLIEGAYLYFLSPRKLHPMEFS